MCTIGVKWNKWRGIKTRICWENSRLSWLVWWHFCSIIGLKGSNGEGDLEGHEVVDDTRIEDGNVIIEILDHRRYEGTQEDVVEYNHIGYDDSDDKENMTIQEILSEEVELKMVESRDEKENKFDT